MTPRKRAEALITLIERGYNLGDIAAKLNISAYDIEELVVSELGQRRLDSAYTVALDRMIDNDLADLKGCYGKDDAVRVQALKARLDIHWKRAVALSPKYHKAAQNGQGAQFIINFTGMGGATLRTPQTIDS